MTFYPELAAALEQQRQMKAKAKEARDERIRKLIAEGLNDKDISTRMGCGAHVVERVRKGMMA